METNHPLVLIVGNAYLLIDSCWREDERPHPDHKVVKLRTAEVQEGAGAQKVVRLGVSFLGPNNRTPEGEKTDEHGFDLEVSCWCFTGNLMAFPPSEDLQTLLGSLPIM